MANGTAPTTLIVQPKPEVTRYNRVVLWGSIGAVVLIVLTYAVVIRDHGQTRVESHKERLTSLPKPLIPEIPKAQPITSPPLPPPKEQPVTWHPTPPASPPAPQKENPLVVKRRKEREDAYRSPMLVAAFSPDKGQPSQEATAPPPASVRYPQTLEIEPMAHREPGPWDERFPPQSPGGSSLSLRASQYLHATLQPPHSPYQLNAGMLIPVVLAQDVTSDVQSFFSAVVTRDVYDSVTSRFLLVPAGSRITFLTDLEDRTNQQPILLMAAKTLYLPNGYSLALQGMPAANSFGMTGLQDQINRHFFQRYGSAAVLSLVVAGIRLATYARSGGGFAYSPEDAAMNGTGSVLGNTVGEDLRHTLTIRPTVVIRAGYPFTVTVTQDVVFPGPYDGHLFLTQREEEPR